MRLDKGSRFLSENQGCTLGDCHLLGELGSPWLFRMEVKVFL
jgi:hypothetical protein